MRNIQLQLAQMWDRQSQGDNTSLSWDNNELQDLQWWLEEQNPYVGQSLQVASPDLHLYTDASAKSW